MSQFCTILCPTDDSKRVDTLVREFIGDRGTVAVSHKGPIWSSITVDTPGASLVLNRLVRLRRGDKFCQMILGMGNFLNQVKTKHKALKADVLQRVWNVALAIGVVAKPKFVEAAGHYDCIFGLAKTLDAIIWIGNGVLNAKGQMLLNGEGTSEASGQ